jgi:hypothetical protein
MELVFSHSHTGPVLWNTVSARCGGGVAPPAGVLAPCGRCATPPDLSGSPWTPRWPPGDWAHAEACHSPPESRHLQQTDATCHHKCSSQQHLNIISSTTPNICPICAYACYSWPARIMAHSILCELYIDTTWRWIRTKIQLMSGMRMCIWRHHFRLHVLLCAVTHVTFRHIF